jgi:hypothetical protein
LVGQTREGNHWEMGSKPELKNIESIVGGVLSERKGKVSIVLQQMINIWMAAEKRKGQPITLRAPNKG